MQKKNSIGFLVLYSLMRIVKKEKVFIGPKILFNKVTDKSDFILANKKIIHECVYTYA